MDGVNFEFVKDEVLKKNIEDSIKFLSTLWLFSVKNKDDREEIYRTIIIYQASIVEALLLYYCDRKKIKFIKSEYSFCKPMAEEFYTIKSDKYNNGRLILGLRHDVDKKFPDFAEVIERLRGTKNLLEDETFARVDKLRDKRNTVHLFKIRERLEKKDVEGATETLLLVVKKLNKKLK